MDEETLEIMANYDLDQDEAERVQELVEEGLDEEEAVDPPASPCGSHGGQE